MAAPKGQQKFGGRQKGTPNKATADIKAAFQKHGDALVTALIKLTKSKDERVKLGAIQACFDRGWGKPPQEVAVAATVKVTKIETVIVDPKNQDTENPDSQGL